MTDIGQRGLVFGVGGKNPQFVPVKRPEVGDRVTCYPIGNDGGYFVVPQLSFEIDDPVWTTPDDPWAPFKWDMPFNIPLIPFNLLPCASSLTVATADYLEDAKKNWALNELAGKSIWFLSGALRNQKLTLAGNTETRYTLSGDLTPIVAGDRYIIWDPTENKPYCGYSARLTGVAASYVEDRYREWEPDALKNYRMVMLTGPNSGLEYPILSNTRTQYTLPAGILSGHWICSNNYNPSYAGQGSLYFDYYKQLSAAGNTVSGEFPLDNDGKGSANGQFGYAYQIADLTNCKTIKFRWRGWSNTGRQTMWVQLYRGYGNGSYSNNGFRGIGFVGDYHYGFALVSGDTAADLLNEKDDPQTVIGSPNFPEYTDAVITLPNDSDQYDLCLTVYMSKDHNQSGSAWIKHEAYWDLIDLEAYDDQDKILKGVLVGFEVGNWYKIRNMQTHNFIPII